MSNHSEHAAWLRYAEHCAQVRSRALAGFYAAHRDNTGPADELHARAQAAADQVAAQDQEGERLLRAWQETRQDAPEHPRHPPSATTTRQDRPELAHEAHARST